MFYFVSFLLVFFLFVSCSFVDRNVELVSTVDSLATTMQEWKEWAESSDEGLWEGDNSHSIVLEHLYTFGGEDDVNTYFFYPEAFAVKGDTVFVSDGSTQKLVCFNLSGELLWSTEGAGEGPGHFSGVSQIAVSDDEIASPVASSPDYAIVLNKPSMNRFQGMVKRESL